MDNFIEKDENLTKAQQRESLKSEGYKQISYSGKKGGFYVKK